LRSSGGLGSTGLCAGTFYLPTVESVVPFALILASTDVKRHLDVFAYLVLVELYAVAKYVEHGVGRVLTGYFDYEVLGCPVGSAGRYAAPFVEELYEFAFHF
jgi:hypothetical protein